MTKTYEIYTALENKLKAVEGLPTRSAPNVPFKPRLGDPFIRDTFLPVEPMLGSIGVDGADHPRGLYQLDLFYPENVATSVQGALEFADKLLVVFKRGVRISTTTGNTVCCELAWMNPPRSIEGFYSVSVLVRWTVYGG